MARTGRSQPGFYRLSPPAVTFPAPSQQIQTIHVTLVAVRVRADLAKRAPRSVLRRPVVVFPSPTPTFTRLLAAQARIAFGRRAAPHSRLGAPIAIPVQPVLSLPRLAITLVAVRTATERSRHLPHSILRPPATLAPPPPVLSTQQWGELFVVHPSRRKIGAWRIRPPPTVLAPLAPPPRVILAGRTRLTVRRAPLSTKIFPPVVTPAISGKAETVPTVVLADYPRPLRRQPHSILRKPIATTASTLAPPIKVVSQTAFQRRLNDWRYWVLHALFAPAVITPVAPLEHTVRVVRAWRTAVEQIRRRPHSVLRPPAVVTPSTPPPVSASGDIIAVTLAGQRKGKWRLRPPAVVAAAAGSPPVVTAITVKLAGRTRVEQQRRAPHYVLRGPAVTPTPPTAVPQATGPTVTLVGLRKGKWQLRPPVVVGAIVLSPPLVTTIQVVLAGRNRLERGQHAGRAKVNPPTVLAPPPAPSLAPALRVISQAPRQRRVNDWRYYVLHQLFAPAIVTPATALEHTIRVVLAGRTRTTLSRRQQHVRIQPPQFLQTAPAAPLTIKLAGRTRAELARHLPHSRLAPPIVIGAVVPPNPYQLAIRTILAGRTRAEQDRRRRLGSKLVPPAVVTPVTVTADRLRMMRGLGL
jgi:hypothetical protein